MKKAFTLLELIFIVIVIGLLAAVGISHFINLKERTVIESMSYTVTTGLDLAVQNAINWMYLEGSSTFKLDDILIINEKELVPGLKWNYTTNGDYNKDGTYSLRDETYATPQVVLRITLNKSENVIKYRINCKNIKISTHEKLREMCIEKWGDEDIQEEVNF
ncbi:type II secretion system protein [Hydrogenimonas thermophila]|uniref:pilus assembly FimT family protein n=1 Tax=Hydrogenimonas thermophila TaxID=223786 RepID=UPI002936EDD1|nr:type II secretion system protein [Hydrogenimonas thermophila]WOE68743.1 type II secretion system protein [Hydrogenimonas thermophila]WOE71253.1 type II secretion system protein [Hydrogenimonas thermophila]